MERILLFLVTILGMTWVGLAVILFAFQPYFIFFPSRDLVAFPDSIGLPYESVYFTAEDGVQLHGWYIPSTRCRATLLFFHGNAGNISHRLGPLWIFNRLGLNTFIIDYRGYGRSQGKPTEPGTYRDAKAAWHYLMQARKIPAEQIVLFGESLGGAIATWIATQHRPAALIIESAFTSIHDMARKYYPYLPTSLLVRVRYPTLERISKVSCPVLIAHSRTDEIVPFAHGIRLFEAAREPKTFLELVGGHNDGFLVTGERFTLGLDQFLSEVLNN